jgi:hypothetical protein
MSRRIKVFTPRAIRVRWTEGKHRQEVARQDERKAAAEAAGSAFHYQAYPSHNVQVRQERAAQREAEEWCRRQH